MGRALDLARKIILSFVMGEVTTAEGGRKGFLEIINCSRRLNCRADQITEDLPC